MREVKFRAYIKHLKWLVPVESINFKVETVEVDLSSGQGDAYEYNFDEVVLMQYTEQNDVNGDLIYEGDIVYQKSVLLGSVDIDFTGEVQLIDGCWVIDNGSYCMPLFNESCENVIVSEYCGGSVGNEGNQV